MKADRKNHILSMKSSVDKLISYFNKKGINFSPVDDKLDNVIFSSDDKILKISHHSFYRFSGIAYIHKENKEDKNQIELVEVTDEMYLNIYMKPIIEMHFTKPVMKKNEPQSA